MVLGDALRAGAGYRDIFLVDAPFHSATPPAYPSLLALLGLFGGVGLYKLASLALTAASVALTYRLGRHYLSRRGAALAAMIAGVSPALLEASHSVLPGALLLFLTVLTLWAAAEAGAATESRPRADVSAGSWLDGLVILSAILAFLTHARAFPLLLAVVIWSLGRGQRRTAAVATGSAIAAAVLWGAFQLRAGPGSESFLSGLFYLGSDLPGGGDVGVAEAATVAARTAWGRASGVLAAYLGDLPMMAGASRRYLPGSLLIVGLALTGWARASGRRPGPMENFALLYVFFAVVGAPEPSSASNLLPVLPVLAIYCVATARWLGRLPERLRGTPSRSPLPASIPVAVAIVFMAPALVETARIAPVRLDCLRSRASQTACLDENVSAFRDVADWARTRTPDDAIVISRQPSMFYWFSGRRGASYRRSSVPLLVMDALDAVGADFLVIDHLDVTTSRYLAPVVRQSPARFRWILSEGQPPTLLLGIEPPEAIVLAAHWEMPD